MQKQNKIGATYVITRVQGESKERFLNMCRYRNILFWNIHWEEDGFIACISRKDFFRLKDICRKTHMKVRIVKKVGFRFVFFHYRERISFVIGCGLAFVIVYLCGLYIWGVSIEGNTYYTTETLKKYLASEHITAGMPVVKVNCDEIERNIRNTYAQIIWVSVEVRGTHLIVHLKENEMNQINQTQEQGDLVAAQDGVVSSMVTRNGTPQVQVGDVVKQGQVLVSGWIIFHDDSTQETGRKQVRADADVLLDTVLSYEKEIPDSYYKKNYHKQNKHSLVIQCGTKMLEVQIPFIQQGEKEEQVLWSQFAIMKSLGCPVLVGRKLTRYYDKIEQEYTQEEATNILQKQFQQDLQDLYENGVQILEKNVKIEKDVSCYRMKGMLHILMPCVEHVLTEEYEMIDEALTGKRDGESEHS